VLAIAALFPVEFVGEVIPLMQLIIQLVPALLLTSTRHHQTSLDLQFMMRIMPNVGAAEVMSQANAGCRCISLLPSAKAT
jgi:hypothetical protein